MRATPRSRQQTLAQNLDLESVFDERVALFGAAKSNRQVITVTHNASFVINTDADQIIAADSGPHACRPAAS